MRSTSKVNYGDTTILLNTAGEKTVCRVSVPEDDDAGNPLTDVLRQWTVYARPIPTQYGAVDQPIVYVMLRLVWGHGGQSFNQDVDATAGCRASVCGSYVEVRARFVDKFGVTLPPGSGAFSSGLQAKVRVVIAPGVDASTEPQLFWTPFSGSIAATVATKLPLTSTAALAALLNQQRLRRIRLNQDQAATLFIQFFDSVAAPVAGAIPIHVTTAGAQGVERDLDFGAQGISFTKGCWVALSTTQDTLTFPVAGNYRVEAQLYRLDSGDGTS